MYHIEDNIYAKDTGTYGKSLFAKKDFKKGELVYVVFGPLITEPNIYTIPVAYDAKSDQLLAIEPRQPEGNLCQYLCHSCDPNMGVKDRTKLVAMRDIEKDEEVTIDYAMIVPEFPEPAWESWKDWECLCGRDGCEGKVKGYFQLSDDKKKKYAGYVSDFILEMEEDEK